MPRTITLASLAAAALVIVIASGGSAAAQSTPSPAPRAVPAPPMTALPDIDINIDLDGIRAQMEAANAFTLDARMYGELTARLQTAPRPPRPAEAVIHIAGRAENNEDRLYQAGTRALDTGRWDEAVAQFQRVAALSGPRADGATYWSAWAENKQGNASAALESLNKLRQTFPSSKWITEARALEVEIRQATGQPVRPESVPDDEVKLVALNSLMRADEQRAMPTIDKMLRGTGSPKLKERALFVLAQSGTPQARQIVVDIAKGGGNPDLQARAVTYLGALGGVETRQALPEIYKASTSVEVKRSILRAFMAAGGRAPLLDVAKTEQSADLRAEAVQQLGAMGAQDELSQLYQSETSLDVRKRIIQSMFAGHNEAKLIQLLRTETDEDLRRSLVQNLGMIASPSSADALVSAYASDKSEAMRRALIDALGQQRNSKALIELAKKRNGSGDEEENRRAPVESEIH